MTHRIDPETNPQPSHTFAVCPQCGEPAIHDVTRLNRGIWLADYLCAGGEHIWSSRWVAAA